MYEDPRDPEPDPDAPKDKEVVLQPFLGGGNVWKYTEIGDLKKRFQEKCYRMLSHTPVNNGLVKTNVCSCAESRRVVLVQNLVVCIKLKLELLVVPIPIRFFPYLLFLTLTTKVLFSMPLGEQKRTSWPAWVEGMTSPPTTNSRRMSDT